MATFDFLFKGQFSLFSYIVLSAFVILLMYLFMLACQLSGVCVKFMLWCADRWDELVDRYEGLTHSSGYSSPSDLSASAASHRMSEEEAEPRAVAAAGASNARESDGDDETTIINRDKERANYRTISL
ncbi:uncharacterized protein LOC135201305 [Macrobrachium nipponense]|uniref:uncharacterized protein LOC135201305 n=1 Tax=Macrobrachium nipponense TaxID=159736 RepID=UPI0030C7F147